MAQYRIRVRGPMGRLAAAFPDLDVTTESVLVGEFADQADLYGTLDHLRDLGVDLAEVHRVDGAVEPDP